MQGRKPCWTNFWVDHFRKTNFHDKCTDSQANLCSSCTLHVWLKCMFTYDTMFGCRWHSELIMVITPARHLAYFGGRGTINRLEPVGPSLYFSMHTVTYDVSECHVRQWFYHYSPLNVLYTILSVKTIDFLLHIIVFQSFIISQCTHPHVCIVFACI